MRWTENNVTSLKHVLIAIVVVLLGLIAMISVCSITETIQERARLDACTTITDQHMRADCIAGPVLQSGYAK